MTDENPRTALIEAVIQNVNLDIYVKVGEHEAPLAMWEDPDHWSEDWATQLDIGADEAETVVDQIITDAIVETTVPS